MKKNYDSNVSKEKCVSITLERFLCFVWHYFYLVKWAHVFHVTFEQLNGSLRPGMEVQIWKKLKTDAHVILRHFSVPDKLKIQNGHQI